jgi:hypothetical protein
VRIGATVGGPRDLPYGGKALFFYTYSTGTHVARRLGSARLRGRAGNFHAALTRRMRLTRRTHFAVCTREPTPDAWGRAVAADRACGRARLPLS